MPNIPVTLSKEGYDTSGLERSYSRVTATPDMFGAAIGRAFGDLGEGLRHATHALDKYLKEGQDQKNEEELANKSARTNLQQPAEEAIRDAPRDGAGLAQTTFDKQKKVIDDTAATIQDPKTRLAYIKLQYSRLPGYQNQAVSIEFKRNEEAAKDDVDTSLRTLDNQVRMDPNRFETAVKDGDALIETRKQISADLREKMKVQQRYKLANSMFEGMLQAARDKNDLLAVEAILLGGRPLRPGGTAQVGNIATEGALGRDEAGKPIPVKTMVVNVDGVATVLPAIGPDGKPISEEDALKRHKETNEHFGKFNTTAEAKAYSKEVDIHQQSLAGNIWHERLKPENYEQLFKTLNAAKQAAQSRADGNAEIALKSIEDRIKSEKTGAINPDEFKYVYDTVQESGNPAHLRKLMELETHERWKKDSYGKSVTQVRQQADALRGGPGSTFPNAHPAIVNIAERTRKWFPEISAPFLVGTMYREYGKHIPPVRAKGVPAFEPTPTGANVQLKGAVDPYVYDALTVAGQTFGQPLKINSGYRSDQHPVERAKFRPGVPVGRHYHTERTAVDISTAGMNASDQARLVTSLIEVGFTGFGQYGSHIHADMREAAPGARGRFSWTTLSPEVQAVMEQRGFRPGATAAQINREGPGQKAMVAGEPPPIDYTQGTSITNRSGQPTSGARGLFQVIPGTWEHMTGPDQKNANTLRIIKEATKDANNPNGIDLAAMTPEQRWQYSKDPFVSALVGAAYATENRKALKDSKVLGDRDPNDAELYMAHLLGAGGATGFLKAYRSTPDAAASAIVGERAADANRPIFFADKGRGAPLTVREVHDRITQSILQAPSQLKYQESVTVGKIADGMDKEIKRNPMGYTQTPLGGSNPVVPLTEPGGYEARGTRFANNAAQYNIPPSENKVFDVDKEIDGIKKQWEEGTNEARMSMLRDWARMDKTGPGAYDAAMKEVGLKDTAYDIAGQLAATNPTAATAIVAGENRKEKDPASIKVLGPAGDADSAFNQITEHSLSSMNPKSRDAIRKGANAHYIDTAFKKGLPFDRIDKKEYARSIQIAVGAAEDENRIVPIDGMPTMIPKGVKPEDFAIVVNNLTNQDLIRFSVSQDGQHIGMLPRYANGDVPTPIDIRNYARFKYVQNDVYRIHMLSVNGELVIPSGRGGGYEPYLIRLNKEAVDEIKSRPNLVRTPPPGWRGQDPGLQPTISGPPIELPPAPAAPTAPAVPPSSMPPPSTPPPSLPPGMP